MQLSQHESSLLESFSFFLDPSPFSIGNLLSSVKYSLHRLQPKVHLYNFQIFQRHEMLYYVFDYHAFHQPSLDSLLANLIFAFSHWQRYYHISNIPIFTKLFIISDPSKPNELCLLFRYFLRCVFSVEHYVNLNLPSVRNSKFHPKILYSLNRFQKSIKLPPYLLLTDVKFIRNSVSWDRSTSWWIFPEFREYIINSLFWVLMGGTYDFKSGMRIRDVLQDGTFVSIFQID